MHALTNNMTIPKINFKTQMYSEKTTKENKSDIEKSLDKMKLDSIDMIIICHLGS